MAQCLWPVQSPLREGGYLHGPIWITQALSQQNIFCIWCQKTHSERVAVWEGYKTKGIIYYWLWRWKGSHGKRQRTASKTWEELQAHSQPGSRDLRLTATWKRILSKANTSFEAGTSPEPPDENLMQPTFWFQPWGTWKGELTHILPDFWLTEWEKINGW